MSEATVRDVMSTDVLTIEPARSLRDAANRMSSRNVGAVIVMDPEQPGPGIVTERDVSRAVGEGRDPREEQVADHVSTNAAYASPDWALVKATDAMAKGGFRHLVVIDGTELVGILSIRDIVAHWSEQRS